MPKERHPCKVARFDPDLESDHTRSGLSASLPLGLNLTVVTAAVHCTQKDFAGLVMIEVEYSI